MSYRYLGMCAPILSVLLLSAIITIDPSGGAIAQDSSQDDKGAETAGGPGGGPGGQEK